MNDLWQLPFHHLSRASRRGWRMCDGADHVMTISMARWSSSSKVRQEVDIMIIDMATYMAMAAAGRCMLKVCYRGPGGALTP